MLILIVIVWAVAGAAAAAIESAYWWYGFPELRSEPNRRAIIRNRLIPTYMMGPLALIAILPISGWVKHGLLWRLP